MVLYYSIYKGKKLKLNNYFKIIKSIMWVVKKNLHFSHLHRCCLFTKILPFWWNFLLMNINLYAWSISNTVFRLFRKIIQVDLIVMDCEIQFSQWQKRHLYPQAKLLIIILIYDQSFIIFYIAWIGDFIFSLLNINANNID